MPLKTFVETLLRQALEEKKSSSDFLLLLCAEIFIWHRFYFGSNTLKEQLGRILRCGNFVLATVLISLEPKHSVISDTLKKNNSFPAETKA